MSFSTREPSQTAFIASNFKRAPKVLSYEEKGTFCLLSCEIKVLCKGKFHVIFLADSMTYVATGLWSPLKPFGTSRGKAD